MWIHKYINKILILMNVHLKSYYVCISLYAGNIAYTIYGLAMFPKAKKADR